MPCDRVRSIVTEGNAQRLTTIFSAPRAARESSVNLWTHKLVMIQSSNSISHTSKRRKLEKGIDRLAYEHSVDSKVRTNRPN